MSESKAASRFRCILQKKLEWNWYGVYSFYSIAPFEEEINFCWLVHSVRTGFMDKSLN